MNTLLKAALQGLSIDIGKSELSGPNYFCLKGSNVEKPSQDLQEIFARVSKGRRQLSTQSADSNKAVEHAKAKCCDYIDCLPDGRKLELVQQLLHKYGGGTHHNRDLKVQFADSLATFAKLDPLIPSYHI